MLGRPKNAGVLRSYYGEGGQLYIKKKQLVNIGKAIRQCMGVLTALRVLGQGKKEEACEQ